jgi:hypothetical protein
VYKILPEIGICLVAGLTRSSSETYILTQADIGVLNSCLGTLVGSRGLKFIEGAECNHDEVRETLLAGRFGLIGEKGQSTKAAFPSLPK